jgi:hypothetical protein
MGMNLIEKTTQIPVLRKRMMQSMRNGFSYALRLVNLNSCRQQEQHFQYR